MAEETRSVGPTLKYRFGNFEFDAGTLELGREGSSIRLQAQPAQVLGLLVGNAGSVVSREKLKQTVWGNDTFVDFERGLNFCMSQIRAALNDSADRSLYIRTIPKKGYCFAAPVTRIDDSILVKGSEPRSANPRLAVGSRRALWMFAILAALLILALLCVLILSYLRSIKPHLGF